MQSLTLKPFRACFLGLSIVALLLLASILMPSASRAQKSAAQKEPSRAAHSAWVEQTLRKMSLREKLGQLLMVTYFGGFTSAQSPQYAEYIHDVDDLHVGGFIVETSRGPLGLERSQVYPTAVITNELQRRSNIPLLIGADFETGTGMRLDEGTSLPRPMALAATGDPKLAYEAGKIVALESRAAGVHWVFAPDTDVNNNPDNPIINIRSFGEDPAAIGPYITAFIRGVEDNGALATAKHFPGHGNVSVDSHIGIATVPGSRAELDAMELPPFRAAIAAGVSSIMPGHLSVPALEPDPNVPATLSHNILTGLLRDQMHFRGLIVTDAMNMGGVASLYPPGEAAVRSIEAGADVLLMPPVPDAAVAALEDAVKSGRIPESRIDDSVRRILQAKERLGLVKNRLVDVDKLNEKFGLPEYRAEAQTIADRGVTLLRDTQKILPLDAAKPLRVLLVSISADPDAYPGETIEPELRSQLDSLVALRADTKYSTVASMKLPDPNTYDVAVVALFVRIIDGRGHLGLPDDQYAFVNRLIAAGKPAIVACFGNPYLISQFPDAPTWIAEFSTNDVSQRAVARALLGQVDIDGKIPVTVPGAVNRGTGIHVPANPMMLVPADANMSERLKPSFALLDRAVADDAFPGGVAAVGYNNQLSVHAFGHLTRDAKSPAVTPDTIYDVASLTKVVATTAAVMKLAERGDLKIDAPVSRYLPEWADAAKSDPDPSWRARVTIKMLMLHDSGLPAHRDFFLQTMGHEAVLAKIMAEPLVREPGTKIEYSDIGFILLGQIVERLTGRPLEEFAKKEIFEPLGMSHSLFNPPRSLRAQIAPTEFDAAYRKRLVQGEVHDENAYALGGVAGSAGLFSTAPDIAAFAQMILNDGIYGHQRLLKRATIREFTAHHPLGDSARAIGWDVPVQPSSSGQYFSPTSFGHTGFTGTSLWIDPERNLFLILLTNRVNPSRDNGKVRQIRPAFCDAVFEALGLVPAPHVSTAAR